MRLCTPQSVKADTRMDELRTSENAVSQKD